MADTILLVEDDRNQQILYHTELAAEGYDVLVASTGKEAIRKVESESPDLVVMDISMPEMDGIEALGRILARDSQMPVILNTAYSSYKDNFMAWAADAYVVKSSDMKELKDAIAEILDPTEESQRATQGKQDGASKNRDK